MHVIYRNRQTDTGENLTFPQLGWQAERITALTDLLIYSGMCVYGRLTLIFGTSFVAVACLSKISGRVAEVGLLYFLCG